MGALDYRAKRISAAKLNEIKSESSKKKEKGGSS